MKRALIISLSFLILAACANFDIKINDNMSSLATMTIPGGNVQLSGNPVWIETSTTRTGVSEQYMLIKVVALNGIIDSEPRIQLIKGTSAKFNIQELVNLDINYLFDAEATGFTKIHSNLVAQFLIEVGEQYVDGNGELQVSYNESAFSLSVIKGRLSTLEWLMLKENDTSFFEEFIQGMRFLTNCYAYDSEYNAAEITIKNVEHEVKVWFYKLTTPIPDPILIIEYTDGSAPPSTIELEGQFDNVLYEVNLHRIVALARNPAKTVQAYYLSTSGQTIKVNVENRYTENHEVLYVLNRYGAVEVLNCYGAIEEQRNIEKSEYTMPLKSTSTSLSHTIIQQSNQNKKSYKLNTGFKALHERRWIVDLLESEKAWFKSSRVPHLPGKNYGIVPVNIQPGSFPVGNSETDIDSITFEVTVAHFE